MNDEVYWVDALKRYIWENSKDSYSWSPDWQGRLITDYNMKDAEMAWNYNYSRHYDTRGDEVATAVLEAFHDGVSFDDLIAKNTKVRQYWTQVQADRTAKLKAAEREKERKRKAAEKKKQEDEARLEAVSKLSPEEREAFGLNAKGYHKR